MKKPTKAALICYYLSNGAFGSQQNLLQVAWMYGGVNDPATRPRRSNNSYFAKSSCWNGSKVSLCLKGLNEFLSDEDTRGLEYEFLCENIQHFEDALAELNTLHDLDPEEGLCAWSAMFEHDGKVSVKACEAHWVKGSQKKFVLENTKFV